jgi:hypothetical protein
MLWSRYHIIRLILVQFPLLGIFAAEKNSCSKNVGKLKCYPEPFGRKCFLPIPIFINMYLLLAVATKVSLVTFCRCPLISTPFYLTLDGNFRKKSNNWHTREWKVN